MRTHRWIITLTALFVLGVAEQALAWGPATHIGLGASILSDLALVPGAIGVLLARHGFSFLYGNIAADVVFAKRLSRVKQFCHHWSTGFRFLDAAEDDRSKAFAYGYLSHLAADTVAHGKYVPRQIVVSQCSINWGHFYWELRADAQTPSIDRALLDRVLRENHETHHRTLAAHMTDTFLPFPLNRLLFRGMNTLAARQPFRRTVDACGRLSRQALPAALLDGFRGESLDRCLSVLARGEQSAVIRDDPNGTSAFMRLHVRRRELRRLRRTGAPTHHRIIETSKALEPVPLSTSSPWICRLQGAELSATAAAV